MKCMVCWRNPIEGLQMICESCRQKRIPLCQPLKGNPACGYAWHARVNNCEACAKHPDWNGGFRCQPCDRCHFCGEVHEVVAAAA